MYVCFGKIKKISNSMSTETFKLVQRFLKKLRLRFAYPHLNILYL